MSSIKSVAEKYNRIFVKFFYCFTHYNYMFLRTFKNEFYFSKNESFSY